MTAAQAKAFGDLLDQWDAVRGTGPRPYDVVSVSRPHATRIAEGKTQAKVSLIHHALRALGSNAAVDVTQRRPGHELNRAQRMRLMRAICAFGTRGKAAFRAGYRAKEQQLREDANEVRVELRMTSPRRPTGVTVAPFLSRAGLPVLLVMRGSSLEGMIEARHSEPSAGSSHRPSAWSLIGGDSSTPCPPVSRAATPSLHAVFAQVGLRFGEMQHIFARANLKARFTMEDPKM